MIQETQNHGEDRDRKADDIIMQTSGGMAALGITNPIPLADAPLLISGWGTMLVRLAACYDVAFDLDGFMLMMKQMPISVWLYVFGVGAFLTITQWTGVGTVPAGIANGALNGAFTYALGKLYKQAFREGRVPTSKEVYTTLKNAKPRK